jgi:3-dehydroquinate dehydratase
VVFINWDVQELSKKYSSKITLPIVRKRLENIRKKLKSFLKANFDITEANADVSQIVAACHSECEYLRGNSVFSTAKEILLICQEIDQGKILSEDDVKRLHRKVSKLINDIDNEILKLSNEVSL